MSERILAGRTVLGPGGQHVNNGSESSMVLVIDDAHRLGAYCATERSQRANIERARVLLARLKDDPAWYAVVDAAIAQYVASRYAAVGRPLDAAREAHDAWRMATVATDAAVAALLGEDACPCGCCLDPQLGCRCAGHTIDERCDCTPCRTSHAPKGTP